MSRPRVDAIITDFLQKLDAEVMRYRAIHKRRYGPCETTVRQIPVQYVKKLVKTFDSLSDNARTLILARGERIEEEDFFHDRDTLREIAAEEDKNAVDEAVDMISRLSYGDRFDFAHSGHFCAAMVLFLRERYDIEVNTDLVLTL